MVVEMRGLTLEQFLRRPERKPALEYEDGVVTQKVSPKLRHSAIQGWWTETVNGFGRPRRLALAFPELRATFAGRSYVPDVSAFRWERLPAGPDGEWPDDVTFAPDLVVEIVSPKQSVTRLIRRCVWYVANGVRVAVLVDPGDRTVMVYRAGQETRVIRGDEPLGLDDVLPGFGATAADLFQSLRRPN